MGELVKVTGGAHRRPDGEVIEDGDVFEATESELDAFGDKFVSVEETDDGEYRSTDADPEPSGAGTYELVHGTHRKVVDGDDVVFEEGDLVELTDAEVEAFGDKFRPVESDESDATDADETDGDESDAESGESASSEDATEASDEDEADESASEGDASDGVDETPDVVDGISVPDADGEYPEAFPEELPDAESWDWDALQEVSKANDVNAAQSKPEQVESLRELRDSEV